MKRKDNISQYFGDVWSAIPNDHYRTAYDIADELEIKHGAVRRLVKEMRESGLPVITSLHMGYKKAVTDAEIWVCIREMQDRVSALQDTILALKRLLRTEKTE